MLFSKDFPCKILYVVDKKVHEKTISSSKIINTCELRWCGTFQHLKCSLRSILHAPAHQQSDPLTLLKQNLGPRASKSPPKRKRERKRKLHTLLLTIQNVEFGLENRESYPVVLTHILAKHAFLIYFASLHL